MLIYSFIQHVCQWTIIHSFIHSLILSINNHLFIYLFVCQWIFIQSVCLSGNLFTYSFSQLVVSKQSFIIHSLFVSNLHGISSFFHSIIALCTVSGSLKWYHWLCRTSLYMCIGWWCCCVRKETSLPLSCVTDDQTIRTSGTTPLVNKRQALQKLRFDQRPCIQQQHIKETIRSRSIRPRFQ